MCLVARPLWGLNGIRFFGRVAALASEGSSELGEGSLVVAHADCERLEVVELVGETHSAAVHEHEVASMVGHLVHLENTLGEHGLFALKEEVLAETHRPGARTALVTLVYSLTRPLILFTELDTLMFLEVKMEGILD